MKTASLTLEELLRLKRDNPARFQEIVENLRNDLSLAHEKEDRPLTARELDTLIEHTCTALGWSKHRVMTEGVLRLRHALLEERPFAPLTPPENASERKGRYLRRFSSIQALILGEVRAATARKVREIAEASSRRKDTRRDPERDPRREPEE